MKNGKLIKRLPKLQEIQDFYLTNIKKLPNSYKRLEKVDIFELKITDKLQNLTNSLKHKYD
jgi:hypothetical protein